MQKSSSQTERSLALEASNGSYGQIPTRLLLAQVKHFYFSNLGTLSQFSGLHCASFFGIAEVVTGLIEMKCYEINEEDISGCGTLAWAAWGGHEGVVKILLGREEMDPNKPDNGG